MAQQEPRQDWSDYEPNLPEVLENPFPAYAWLRAHSPVHFMPKFEAYALSRYDDILQALRTPEIFSSVGGVGFRPPKAIRQRPGFTANDSGGSGECSMSRSDHPLHTRLRRLLGTSFTIQAIEKFRSRAEARFDELLDEAMDRPVNFVTAVAARYLPSLMGEWMGISPDDWTFINRGAHASSAVQSGNYDDSNLQQIAEYRAYFADIARSRGADLACGAFRRDDPRDLSDRLFGKTYDGVFLNETEITANLVILANGGNGNTSHFISALAMLFADRPDLLEAIRADRAIIPPALEEFLRFFATTHGLCRVTKQDVTIHGTTIPEDTSVLLLYGSANRDERHYDSPETIRLGRFPKGVASADHLTFANGVHICLGQSMARLLSRVMLERFAERVKAVERVGPIRRGSNYQLRALEDVPLRLHPL